MNKVEGLHHIAICTSDMKSQIAFKVQDHKELMAMRDRLRSKGVPVVGPMDHGLCV
jgi:hypothetical protein